MGSFVLRLAREQPIEYYCNIKIFLDRLGTDKSSPAEVKAQSFTGCSKKEYEISCII